MLQAEVIIIFTNRFENYAFNWLLLIQGPACEPNISF
jgi:hypothetical protein